jgi:hypothetical protein
MISGAGPSLIWLMMKGAPAKSWHACEERLSTLIVIVPLPSAEAAGEPKIIKNTPSAAAITPATSRMNRPVLLVMRSPPS